MRCQAPRWAHSTDPRHETEQRGYDLIGAMLKRRRVLGGLTQRELERLTGIDQTVISRLENGRQYGLRWSRFAILVARLDGLDAATAAPPPPWWVRMGIAPPHAFVEQLQHEGLLPPDYEAPLGSPTGTEADPDDAGHNPDRALDALE
jgi:transcriptional regulator with XRE-family HTH domain